MIDAATSLQAYRRWIVDRALPCWATRGFDAARGMFRERLNFAGDPLEVPLRAMVQARQIYVYATAARIGWFAEGAALAEQALARLVRAYGDVGAEEASFAFSIDADGAIVSNDRDAYAHAFILFALAAIHRLNGDPAALALADKIITFIQKRMTDSVHGGLFDCLPDKNGDKRQNPHMHLLEAYLFLHRAAPDRGYLDLAEQIVALFEVRLFDGGSACLLEYFEADWQPHRDKARAAIWEPGHHMEWVWLFDEYARAAGRDLGATARLLFDTALDHGLARDGLLFDEVDARQKSVVRASTRLWPHTEAIKAAVARGGGEMEQFAGRIAKALHDHFLDKPFAGGWIDHLTAERTPMVDYVPASSVYHIFLAGEESGRGFSAEPATGGKDR